MQTPPTRERAPLDNGLACPTSRFSPEVVLHCTQRTSKTAPSAHIANQAVLLPDSEDWLRALPNQAIQ
jgi:hypothetical protein